MKVRIVHEETTKDAKFSDLQTALLFASVFIHDESFVVFIDDVEFLICEFYQYLDFHGKYRLSNYPE